MQKIKLKVLNKIISSKLSRYELLFLFEIAKYQMANGTVSGVYYKDICRKIGYILDENTEKMSYQRFYDVMRSLEEKGIISIDRVCKDYDITILDNDFTKMDFSEGYISLSHTFFYSKAFASLKAGEMTLVLELIKNCESNMTKKLKNMNAPGIVKIRFKNFLKTYSEKLGVSTRVLKSYVETLKMKKFFTFSLNESGMLFIQQRKIVMAKWNTKVQSKFLRKQQAEKLIRRTKVNSSEQDYKDMMFMFNKFGRYLKDKVFSLLEFLLINRFKLVNQGCKNIYKWKRSFERKWLEERIFTLYPFLRNKVEWQF